MIISKEDIIVVYQANDLPTDILYPTSEWVGLQLRVRPCESVTNAGHCASGVFALYMVSEVLSERLSVVIPSVSFST
jgi:hypothetical protein